MEEANTIQEIIGWYNLLPSDYLGVNELMMKRQKLSAESFYFSNSLGLAREQWNRSQAITETNKNQLRVKFGSNTKADYQARANVELELKTEKQSEALFYSMKYELDQINQVLSAMNQQIAYIREELKYSRYTGT